MGFEIMKRPKWYSRLTSFNYD